MAEIAIKVETRDRIGSSNSKRLRHSGWIPGVLYGKTQDAIPVSIDARDLRSALSTDAGLNALLRVNLEGKYHLTMAREIQKHPVRHTISHVDLMVVEANDPIVAEVPLVLIGEAQSVSRGDGRVEQLVFNLQVKAVPRDIPHSIEVDITEMKIHDTIKIGDIKLGSGMEFEGDKDIIVVIGQPPRGVKTLSDETTEES